ncbi:MAG: OadG family protein [Magnetococcales bacterium]|nr:OadG family protein [Magnetococcales bacterium]
MSITELISKGLELMVLGMGTVFVFLAVLVFTVTKMSELIQNYEKNLPQPEPKPSRGAVTSSDPIAAIAAAVHRYRSDHPS